MENCILTRTPYSNKFLLRKIKLIRVFQTTKFIGSNRSCRKNLSFSFFPCTSLFRSRFRAPPYPAISPRFYLPLYLSNWIGSRSNRVRVRAAKVPGERTTCLANDPRIIHIAVPEPHPAEFATPEDRKTAFFPDLPIPNPVYTTSLGVKILFFLAES